MAFFFPMFTHINTKCVFLIKTNYKFEVYDYIWKRKLIFFRKIEAYISVHERIEYFFLNFYNKVYIYMMVFCTANTSVNRNKKKKR